MIALTPSLNAIALALVMDQAHVWQTAWVPGLLSPDVHTFEVAR
jgi:hypothetical protein